MLLRHVARPLLAVPFVVDGLGAALRPSEHVEAAAAAADEIAGVAPGVPRLSRRQLTLAVRAHGVATAVAGVLLALHKAPRTAALALVALTLPLVVANEPFTSSGPARSQRAPRFVRNLGAVGAALLAAADTEGRPGVLWRVEHARVNRDAPPSGTGTPDGHEGTAR